MAILSVPPFLSVPWPLLMAVQCPVIATDLTDSGYGYGDNPPKVWRVLRALEDTETPATAFVCALALERHPELCKAISRQRLDICCHGWRWEDHIAMPEQLERSRIGRAVRSIKRSCGAAPIGWYCRTAPSINTRRLLAEHGGFDYDSDGYNDDLPYYVSPSPGRPETHLVIPYSLCTNDSKFAPGRAFSTAGDFYEFMTDAADALLAEATATGRPKMMSIGLHPRLIGQPARISGLRRLLKHFAADPRIWRCRRTEIATHWRSTHPPRALVPAGVPVQPLSNSSVEVSRGDGSPPKARLLITGGAGFVLSNVVREWLAAGSSGATAVVFDRARAWDPEVQRYLAAGIASGRLAFFNGDVSSPVSWAELEAEHGTDFTHVVSGAAITPTVAEEAGCPTKVLEVNLLGHVRCLEFARLRCSKLHRLVYTSSDAVLGVRGLITSAVAPAGSARGTAPGALPAMSLYASAKVAGEAATARYNSLYGIDTGMCEPLRCRLILLCR